MEISEEIYYEIARDIPRRMFFWFLNEYVYDFLRHMCRASHEFRGAFTFKPIGRTNSGKYFAHSKAKKIFNPGIDIKVTIFEGLKR